MKREDRQVYMPHINGIFRALIVSNGLSLGLFLLRVLNTQSLRFGFLPWNLVLAWLPLMLAYWLKKRLKHTTWLNVGNLLLTLLWLAFLPNSFYIVSDLIHLFDTGEIGMLFDAALFFSFIFNGFVAGFLSIYLIHVELLKRKSWQLAHLLIGSIFFLCGFAIYLGRYLRWNTWDVLAHPLALLFDVSEQVINPITYPQSFLTTILFFSLLASMYAVIFQLVARLKFDMLIALDRRETEAKQS